MYWLEAVFGLALIAAPFALGYNNNPAALWASIVLGVVVMLVSGYKAYVKTTERWEGWVDVIAGVAAILVRRVCRDPVRLRSLQDARIRHLGSGIGHAAAGAGP